jgi:hypothetical protein
MLSKRVYLKATTFLHLFTEDTALANLACAQICCNIRLLTRVSRRMQHLIDSREDQSSCASCLLPRQAFLTCSCGTVPPLCVMGFQTHDTMLIPDTILLLRESGAICSRHICIGHLRVSSGDNTTRQRSYGRPQRLGNLAHPL